MAEGLLDVDAAARFIGVIPKELSRLANEGIIPRQSGRFHPVQLVQAYIKYVCDKNDDDKPCTQVELGEHLGVSDRSIREICKRNGWNSEFMSRREFRLAYIEDLREKAAGRSGEDQAALTKARTQDAMAGANLKELQYHQTVGNLVPVNEIEPLLVDWAANGRAQVVNAKERAIAAIESKYDIEIDPELVDEPFAVALESIGGYAQYLDGDVEESREGLAAPEIDSDL